MLFVTFDRREEKRKAGQLRTDPCPVGGAYHERDRDSVKHISVFVLTVFEHRLKEAIFLGDARMVLKVIYKVFLTVFAQELE